MSVLLSLSNMTMPLFPKSACINHQIGRHGVGTAEPKNWGVKIKTTIQSDLLSLSNTTILFL